ncbi:MAG TPA: ferrous iron transporter B, partial [Ruminococcaceae bacterium]|nr:ferrous iron transporter B [Oscillospiraceae bacterium]
GDWQILVALVTGFMAKESVVSTLEILYTGGAAAAMTTLTALSFLVFSLIYTPCVAAIAAIKRELGGKWAAFVVVWQCAVAWLIAFIVHFIGVMLGGV